MNRQNNIQSLALPLITCLFIGFLGLFVACQSDERDSQTNDYNYNTFPSEYVSFAQELEKAVNNYDTEFINQHFDIAATAKSIVAEIGGPDDYQKGFIEGVLNSLDIGQQIIHAMEEAGTYKLLRLREKNGNPAALYRIVSREGLNYHEFYLDKNAADSIYVKDFYIYMGAQDFSATLRRLYISSLGDLQDSLELTNPTEMAFIQHLSDIDTIGRLLVAEDFTKALATLDSLPPELQKDKMMLIMRLNISFNIDSLTYQQAVAKFHEHYPDDAVVELMMLDFSFLKGNAQEALKIIDQLDQKVGGDPHLNIIRADIHQETEDLATAEKLVRQTIAQETNNEEAYWSLVMMLLEQDKHELVIAEFEKMYEKFDLNPATLLLEDGYPKFWESDAYKAWAEKHPLN